MSLKSRTLSVLLPLFCVFGLLLFSDIPASAQSASVSGRVIDPSSAIVRKAQITFTDMAKGTSQTTQTNDGGFYSLPFVQPGIYTLTVESSGFKRFERTKITVETAQSLVVDVRLQVGDVSQSVMVDGSGSYINTTDASVSTVVDRQFVENIPLNGRSFQSLLTVVPGVQLVPSNGIGYGGEVAVNGQRTESNNFTVDGISANTGVSTFAGGVGGGYSGTVPGESALGTTQSMASIDDLQEFRATTSTYSAEYGRTPGGQFTFSTRSGTNEWHGSAFDYFRNDALDANNYFNKRTEPITPRQPERQNDFGGTFGGPIIIPHLYNGTDKTFFFFSYEGLRLTSPHAATPQSVPNAWLRQNAPVSLQPIVNAFPRPVSGDTSEGTGLETLALGYSAPSSIDASSIRVDHTFKDRLHVFARYADTPTNTLSRYWGDLALVQSTAVNVKVLTLGATYTINPKLTNDLHFNITRNDNGTTNTLDGFGGATPMSLGALPGFASPNADSFWFFLLFGDTPNIYIAPGRAKQSQINLVDSLSYSTGRHALKFGIDYRRLRTSQIFSPVFETGWFPSPDDVVANNPDYVGISKSFNQNANPIYTNLSAFVQDDWKVNSRLSLSLGLRWDVNPAPIDANGDQPYTLNQTADLATSLLAPRGSSLWRTDWSGIAPRIGLAYQIHQERGRETVVRAGAGLFYDSCNVQGSQGYSGIGYGNSIAAGTDYGTPSSFPVSQSLIDSVPEPSVTAPYGAEVIAFNPHLRLPYTAEWNLAVEQSLGASQTLTLTYVGSAGRRLLLQKAYYPYNLGNTNFAPTTEVAVTDNMAAADYNSLQVQFQRRLSHGLQMLAAYTWAHAFDNATQNEFVYDPERAASDYDIRHNFQVALTYDIPRIASSHILSQTINHWSVDARVSARSSLPVDVIGQETTDPISGTTIFYHPNRIPNIPLYVSDPQAPGGRAINCEAFIADCDPSNLPAGEGNAGRNVARGFDAVQSDLAVHREFAFTEKFGLQFRAEAFNIFNHPIMGSIENLLSAGNSGPGQFGYVQNTQNSQLGGLNSLYQVGGPRSLQLALRLHF